MRYEWLTVNITADGYLMLSAGWKAIINRITVKDNGIIAASAVILPQIYLKGEQKSVTLLLNIVGHHPILFIALFSSTTNLPYPLS